MCGVRHLNALIVHAAQIDNPKQYRDQLGSYNRQLNHSPTIVGFAKTLDKVHPLLREYDAG